MDKITDRYSKKNREWWDEATPVHARSEFYDVKGFEAGRNTLTPIEREELGDVSGKSLLHLQCHFGMDTLSWARLGARVTGVDFSEKAITLARSLSAKTGVEAKFICCDIYELPNVLDEQFDIVFTSQGVLCWLSDLPRWGHIIARFLKKGGVFYIFEGHPFSGTLEYGTDSNRPEVKYAYFAGADPIEWPPGYDYADQAAKLSVGDFEWTHPLSEVLNSLIAAGLRIDFLHEFPVVFYQVNPLMKRDEHGWWRLEGDRLPLSFSIMATKNRESAPQGRVGDPPSKH